MVSRRILAVDQGTTNTKVLIVDETGAILARASRPVEIACPQPGWVEQDATALWRSVAGAIDACLAAADGLPIDAIAVTNQRESVIAWDRATGRPVGPCVNWQCRRTAAFCAELKARGLDTTIAARTGLPIDPLFSASKARWLLDRVPDGPRRAAAGELCLGTVDSWVIWNLTGGAVHATDASNASRTQLLDLRAVSWDDELLQIFGVPLAALPRIQPSSSIFGRTIALGRLEAGIPIGSAIGDSHAALFGQSAGRSGIVKATYGTGSSLMTLSDDPSPSHYGLSTTVAWWLGDRACYALEGNITVTGGGVDWLAQVLGVSGVREIAQRAAEVSDNGGVYIVPAFAGLGAPYWDDGARGLMCGLTRGTTAGHLSRAMLEAIAYQVRDVFEAMQADSGRAISELFADGGASENDALMQFQADILGCTVRRNRSADLSAAGAAWLAGLSLGVWRSLDDVRNLPRHVDCFEPRMSGADGEKLYDGWRAAVGRTRRVEA